MHSSFWNLPQYWKSYLIVLQWCYMFHIRLVLLCNSELVAFDGLNVQWTSHIFPFMQNWLAPSHCSNNCSQTREEQILCTKSLWIAFVHVKVYQRFDVMVYIIQWISQKNEALDVLIQNNDESFYYNILCWCYIHCFQMSI